MAVAATAASAIKARIKPTRRRRAAPSNIVGKSRSAFQSTARALRAGSGVATKLGALGMACRGAIAGGNAWGKGGGPFATTGAGRGGGIAAGRAAATGLSPVAMAGFGAAGAGVGSIIRAAGSGVLVATGSGGALVTTGCSVIISNGSSVLVSNGS